MATTEPSKPNRRKRRWGDGPAGGNGGEESDVVADKDDHNNNNDVPPPPTASHSNGGVNNGGAATPSPPPPPPPPAPTAPSDPKARAAALQASIRARLDALKARTVAATTTTVSSSTASDAHPRPPEIATTAEGRPAAPGAAAAEGGGGNKSKKRARLFELDMSTTTSDRILEREREREGRNRSSAPAVRVNPYLAHAAAKPPAPRDGGGKDAPKVGAAMLKKEGGEAVAEGDTTAPLVVDSRLASKPERARSRPLNFVVPGTYVALGEKKRALAANAEESGYISGRKAGNVFISVGMGGATAVGVVDEDPADVYGASEAGRAVEARLPARVDAPELELEDRRAVVGGRIGRMSTADDVDGDDAATTSALSAATSSMPYAMEWWDAELLPGKLRKELAGEEGRAIASRVAKKRLGRKDNGADDAADATAASEVADGADASARYRSRRERHDQLIARCYRQASMSHSRTHGLVQHPIPVLTPAQRAAAEASRNRPPTLHLTRAECKRHRKLRRAERMRDRQDMQAAGLVPPPEPRLTLSNYMKVLGDQAILDPSRMEAAVVSQIQGRKMKHEKMNAERKLTKEQRSARNARKLEEDTSQSVCVALFYVRDMGHPYHRTKVDLNAQQNGITGGVLECEQGIGGGMALVVAEGGERAVKRYTRLMTVRMRWKGEDFYEDDDDDEDEVEDMMVGDDDIDDERNAAGEDGGGGTKTKVKKRKKFNPDNECVLIWSGMAIKRAFHSFMFQHAESSVVARKILEAKGVAHYWDLAVGHAERKAGDGGSWNGDGELKFRLGDGAGG